MKHLDPDKARTLLAKGHPGDFEVLDVRQEWEYSEMHVPGARLIPLPQLADKIRELDPDRPLIVYCRSGARSHSAAQYLEGQGFSDVSNLQGGIMAWQGETAEGAWQLGLDLLSSLGDLADVFSAAYNMEFCLAEFYSRLADQSSQEAVRKLFHELAGFEDKHMNAIYALYRRSVEPALDRASFAARTMHSIGEGGVAPQWFLHDEQRILNSVSGGCELAMSIEAQALDFYSRCAQHAETGEQASVFFRLAKEEQSHLRMIGRFFDAAAKDGSAAAS